MKQFTKVKLTDSINVSSIVTIHYFEYTKNYNFSGEAHDFWEIVYIDRGNVQITAQNNMFILKQGEAVFHRPNEYHEIAATGDFANVVVLSFDCLSPAMNFFNHKIIALDKDERQLVSNIIKEGKNAFAEPLNIVDLTKMTKRTDCAFGALQMIKINLEALLISLIRSETASKKREMYSSLTKDKSDDAIFLSVKEYLEKNVSKNLTVEDVCNRFFFSKTFLKMLFKQRTGGGIIHYFLMLKIEEAKRMISESEYTFTEIAEKLSFGSIHYFSRIFKKYTNMTPTEYEKSIKAKGIL